MVLAIVVTTGIASIFLTKDFTPDYNSGLAHAIFYALTKYPVIEQRHLHGEVVGFGVLLDHVETLDDSPLVLYIDLKHAARFLLALAFTGNHIDGVPILDM